MRQSNWEDEILNSPKGLSPEVYCPSPERMAISRVFELSEEEFDHFRRLPPAQNHQRKADQSNLAKLNDKLNGGPGIASEEERNDDSSYSQSEDYSEGSRKHEKKIPLLHSGLKKRKMIKKIRKGTKCSSFIKIEERHDNELSYAKPEIEDDSKNLKSISREVYRLINHLKPSQTFSNDELARKILSRQETEGHKDKNIRRRLYDSINVLEAVGLVKKMGGKNAKRRGAYTMIESVKYECDAKGDDEIQRGCLKQQMREKIRQMEARVGLKKERLQNAIGAKRNLEELIKRNIQKEGRNDEVQVKIEAKQEIINGEDEGTEIKEDENPYAGANHQQKIFFPLYIFQVKEGTKFTHNDHSFAYSGSLHEAYSPMDILQHISFTTEQKMVREQALKCRKQKKAKKI